MAVNYKKLNLDAAAIRDSISQRQTGIRKPENVSPYTTNRPKPTVADQTASQLPNMANISPYTSARPKPAAASSTTARANQGLPSAQQSYVQQAGAAAGNVFQQAWAREMWNRQQPAATGALQLNVGEMRNALQNGMPGNWRSANAQNPQQTSVPAANAAPQRDDRFNAEWNRRMGYGGTAAGDRWEQALERERQWQMSQGANQAGAADGAAQTGAPAANAQNGYVSQNADRMNDLRTQMGELADQYANRGPFQVNLANDALYRQYAQQYAQMGKRAMQDTMGQAAGLTGGYGSSYAQNVGQQAYNQQLQGLNDAALSIYDRAKARWDSEGDAMLRQMDLLGNQYERERAADTEAYSRWRDQVSDDRYAEERDYNRNWEKMKWDYGVSQDALNNEWKERDWNRTGDWHDQDFAHTLAREQVQDDQWQRTFGYNQYRDQVADDQWERTFGYNQYRDQVADNQWQRTFGYNQYRDQVADDQWERTFGYNQYRDQVADNQWQQTFGYNQYRDQVADNQWQQDFDRSGNQWQQGFDREGEQLDYNRNRDSMNDGWQQAMTWLKVGIVPDASVLQAAGISAADAQRLASYYSRANAGSYGGSSGGSSGRRSSGGRSSGSGSGSGSGSTVKPSTTPSTTPSTKPQTTDNGNNGNGIGSDAWIDSYAKQYARLVNNHKDPQAVFDAIVGEYVNEHGKQNDTAIQILWGKIQQQVANAGYIRGNRNAYEGEMP